MADLLLLSVVPGMRCPWAGMERNSMGKTRMGGLGPKAQATAGMSLREPLCATDAQVITDNKIIIPKRMAIGHRYSNGL
jgi:hypothetical protein